MKNQFQTIRIYNQSDGQDSRIRSIGLLLFAFIYCWPNMGVTRPFSYLADQQCQACHPDIFQQWSASAHRHSSFTNPYYRFAAEQLIKDRGIQKFTFCARCHDPALLDQIETKGIIDVESKEAKVGIGCVLCHSINHTDLRGNGLYTINHSDFTFSRAAHRQRFEIKFTSSTVLCAGCHKVGLSQEITHDRWQRGQNESDQWSQSAFAHNDPLKPLAHDIEPHSCIDCHMKKVKASAQERGAKGGFIKSHQFWSANATILHFKEQKLAGSQMAQAFRKSLKMTVSSLDYFGQNVLEVTLLNQGVGHRFPGGVNDSNQVWLEVTQRGENNELLTAHGLLDDLFDIPMHLKNNRYLLSNNQLPIHKHLIRIQPVNVVGQPISKRDVQNTYISLFDSSLYPHEPRLIRYELHPQAKWVEVRLLMRQFSHQYVKESCEYLEDTQKKLCRQQPIMTVAQEIIKPQDPSSYSSNLGDHNLYVYLIALLKGSEVDLLTAKEILKDPWLLLNSEEYDTLEIIIAKKQGQTDRLITLLRQITTRSLNHSDQIKPWYLWYEAQALLKAFRSQQALWSLEVLYAEYPQQWTIMANLARAYSESGHMKKSLNVISHLLTLNPEHAGAWRLKALAMEEICGDQCRSEIDLAFTQWEKYYTDQSRQSKLRRMLSQGEYAQYLRALPMYSLSSQLPQRTSVEIQPN